MGWVQQTHSSGWNNVYKLETKLRLRTWIIVGISWENNTCAEEWRLGSSSCPLWLSSTCLLHLLHLRWSPSHAAAGPTWLTGEITKCKIAFKRNTRLNTSKTPTKSNNQRAKKKMLVLVPQHLTKGGWRSVEQGRPHSHSCFDGRGAGRSNTP